MDWAKFKRTRLIHLCFAISFFTSGLIINIMQCILYVCLKPINKRLYRKIGYYLCYSFYCQVVFIADWWSGSKLYVTMDEKDIKEHFGKEHCLLMMNHTYEIDWLIGWVFCEKNYVLGNCKAYAKKSIQYMPTLGWAWKFAEFVFLERSYDKDKENIKRQISEIYDYPDPTWLLLNAEGTRFTPAKHIASQKFAAERGLPVLKHHLTPRTKGFTASLEPLKAKCPAIYDIVLTFKKDAEVQPTVSNLLFGRPVTGYMNVRRIPMSEVPADEIEAANWLQKHFQEKDEMMDKFFKTGSFSEDSSKKTILMKPRLATLLNTACWALVTLTPMLYYLTSLLLSGELLYFSIGAGIISCFYLLMHKTIGMSKISKASSYGVEGSPSKKTE